MRIPPDSRFENESGWILTLSYQRDLEATDVSFLLQKADSLDEWTVSAIRWSRPRAPSKRARPLTAAK